MSALELIAAWPVPRAAAAQITPGGEVETFGDPDQPFPLASITKLLTSMAALVAHEEGTLDLDEPIIDNGSTPADLLSHAAGIAPEERSTLAAAHTRRIYSTAGYDILADHISERSAMPFADYLREAVLDPLGMTPHPLVGSAGAGAVASVNDLLALAVAWQQPLLIHRSTLARAMSAHLPDLDGVLPGFGRQSPNPWCLGPELRGAKIPHWTGSANSAITYGHFGQTGTMLWIDPVAGHTLIVLTDRPFGSWAAEAWPTLSDAVLSANRRGD